jgi:hypothetical protein
VGLRVGGFVSDILQALQRVSKLAFLSQIPKIWLFKTWLALQNSFGFLAFSWRFYMLKLSARK